MDDEARRPSTLDRLASEFDRRHAVARGEQAVVQPTPEEARNGWTAESLTDYLAQRRAAQALRIDKDSLSSRLGQRSGRQNNRYSPLRWRA